MIYEHEQRANAHSQYLSRLSAPEIYASNADVENGRADHLAQENPHGITTDMIGAAYPAEWSAIATHLSDDHPD